MPAVLNENQIVDPSCAHCVLAVRLHQFMEDGPPKDSWQIVGELVQLTAEFAAANGVEFREHIGPGWSRQVVQGMEEQILKKLRAMAATEGLLHS